jgi:hypothetical protein
MTTVVVFALLIIPTIAFTAYMLCKVSSVALFIPSSTYTFPIVQIRILVAPRCVFMGNRRLISEDSSNLILHIGFSAMRTKLP